MASRAWIRSPSTCRWRASRAVVMTLVALLCGLAPARQAGALDVADALKEEGRSSTGARTLRARSGLLVVQIGLAVVLLVGAGLILRSFAGMRQIDLGFDPAQVLSVQVDPRIEPDRQNAWVDDLLARVATHPEVECRRRRLLAAAGARPDWPRHANRARGPARYARRWPARNPLLNYQVAHARLLPRHAHPAEAGPLSSPPRTRPRRLAWPSSARAPLAACGRVRIPSAADS